MLSPCLDSVATRHTGGTQIQVGKHPYKFIYTHIYIYIYISFLVNSVIVSLVHLKRANDFSRIIQSKAHCRKIVRSHNSSTILPNSYFGLFLEPQD